MKQKLKRALDITGALGGLIVFAPIMLLVALGVKLTMGGPVIFRQNRPGLHTEGFDILKFRSMKNGHDDHGRVLSDEARLTRFGTFIREYSLDELPQLINILKGEMSIVGPRPLLFEYFPFYTPIEMRRHEVKPGVTGWAQIHGRNNLDWDARLAKDIWYVDHWSVWLDIKIILRTIKMVFTRDGVKTDGHATFLRLDDARRQAAPAGKN